MHLIIFGALFFGKNLHLQIILATFSLMGYKVKVRFSGIFHPFFKEYFKTMSRLN